MGYLPPDSHALGADVRRRPFTHIPETCRGTSHRIEVSRTTARFTLIELLVVVTVIAILLAMLLPALSQAKGTAIKASCIGRMKQLGVGLQMYAGNYDGFIPYLAGRHGGNIFGDSVAPAYGDALYSCRNSFAGRIAEVTGDMSNARCPSDDAWGDNGSIGWQPHTPGDCPAPATCSGRSNFVAYKSQHSGSALDTGKTRVEHYEDQARLTGGGTQPDNGFWTGFPWMPGHPENTSGLNSWAYVHTKAFGATILVDGYPLHANGERYGIVMLRVTGEAKYRNNHYGPTWDGVSGWGYRYGNPIYDSDY